jgi:hypothetical protein
MRIITLGAALTAAMLLVGCDDSAARKESQKVMDQQSQYGIAQPVPVFNWSLERHIVIELYKARNSSVATYTYVRNQYTGKVLSSCKSIGFPISAATQLTAPEGLQYLGTGPGYRMLPQAEPNGVFPPSQSRGTWVLCASKDGKATPRYYEEDVEAYVTQMVERDGQLVEADGSDPTVTIDVRQR